MSTGLISEEPQPREAKNDKPINKKKREKFSQRIETTQRIKLCFTRWLLLSVGTMFLFRYDFMLLASHIMQIHVLNRPVRQERLPQIFNRCLRHQLAAHKN